MHCGRKIKHPQTSAQAAGFGGVLLMGYEKYVLWNDTRWECSFCAA